MNPHDAEVLDALLKTTLQAMKDRVPDWYGRAMRALAEVSQNEVLSELARQAYHEQIAEALEQESALPGVH